MRANFPFVIMCQYARFDFNASNKLEFHYHSIISETQYLKREWQLSWCLTIFGILECIKMAQSIIYSTKINWLFQFYQSFHLIFFFFLSFGSYRFVSISIQFEIVTKLYHMSSAGNASSFQALLCKLHLCERVQIEIGLASHLNRDVFNCFYFYNFFLSQQQAN